MRRVLFSFLLLLSLFACSHRNLSAVTPPVQTVPVNGVDIGYTMTGQGEPLLMVMGYAGTMDVWDPTLVDRLAENYTVIRFDNRNIGYSSTSDEEVTMELMARDGLALLDALGIEKAHVMGWSMGSIIAQTMTLMQPEKIDKVVLYATASEPGPVLEHIDSMKDATPEMLLARLFPKAWIDQNPDVYSRLPSPVIPADPKSVKRQYVAITKWQGTKGKLKDVTKEVLVLSGEQDDITTPDLNLAVASEIPTCSIVRFNGAGHWLMYQAGEQMAGTVHQFIETRHDLILKN